MPPADPIQPRRREPLTNAPLPPLLLAGLLVALFAIQLGAAPGEFDALALIPAKVRSGQLEGLVTYLFLHGGWAHVGLNGLGLLAFGAGVARLFGPGVRGTAVFLAFYLLCGVLAGAGFVLLNPDGETPVVGASGAVAGLMAGASRLISEPGRVSGFGAPPVVAMGAAWLAINLVAAVFGTLPGAGGAPVAWEAHLVGYVAGLLLVGPFARLAGR